MREIAPGLWHWTARNERIGAPDETALHIPALRALACVDGAR